jgi:hypothetical protein
MSKMVETCKVMSVADLYAQYGLFARHYDLADNPLTGLTRYIPKKARYFAVAPITDMAMTEDVMKRVAGRRKLRYVQVHKDEIKSPAFQPTDEVMIFYS